MMPAAPEEDSHLAAARAHLDSVLYNTQNELSSMRAQMAEARLAAAEKEARVQEMARQLAEARRASIEVRQSMELERTELLALQSERDQLVQAKRDVESQIQSAQSAKREVERQLADLTQAHRALQLTKKDLEGRVSEVQQLQQAASEARLSEAQAQMRMKELETLLGQLTTELAQAKEEAAQNKKVGTKRSDKPHAAKRSPEPAAADARLGQEGTNQSSGFADQRANQAGGASAPPTLDSLMKERERPDALVKPGTSSKVMSKAPEVTTAQLRDPPASGSRQAAGPAAMPAVSSVKP
jgi:chromosome segregation ATPase